ncbi:hypothetical protein Scep_021822 [Stephania cephalantha]|uniref:ABC transporter A family member 2 n=1 Tax=Stephania cephalantha TaxID=152367 RepID=A0AAP0FCF7_9MAGN
MKGQPLATLLPFFPGQERRPDLAEIEGEAGREKGGGGWSEGHPLLHAKKRGDIHSSIQFHFAFSFDIDVESIVCMCCTMQWCWPTLSVASGHNGVGSDGGHEDGNGIGALSKKNLLLSWRHKRSTLVQLFSSLFFIFLIFCIQKAIDARLAETTAFQNVFEPETLAFPAIPSCEDKFFTKIPCFDFVWSGNPSAAVRSILRRIIDDNPGRPIPSTKVKSFGTPEEVDAWLFSDPIRCFGAIHFVERNATVICYGIQTNSTLMPMRDPNFSWSVGFKEFAHPAFRSFSAMSLMGPTFFLAIAMFDFVFQMGSLVAEKELKLRQAMSMMGLYETSYWLSWLIWEAFITLLSSVFTVLFGMMFQFNFFLHNSFAVLLLLFFLFQLNMIGFAFFISTFISKSSSATTIGFCTFIIGFLTQLVTTFGFPYNDIISKRWRVIWSLFPPNLLAKALDQLADATATTEEGCLSICRSLIPPLDDVSPDDDDVLEEEVLVKKHVTEDAIDPNVAVQIRGITKTYPGTTNMGCCKCKRTSPYHAVKFDILWDSLSGQEHLYIFASVKGLSRDSTKLESEDSFSFSPRGFNTDPAIIVKSDSLVVFWMLYPVIQEDSLLLLQVVENSLAEVKLTSAAKVRVGRYSGGIKRRLSVAIALIGNPKLTTGMDPITRRHVWDIIENAKTEQASILTTHSMEEADILGDRVAIMAKGKLRCIGTSIRLKSRFGTGFVTNVSFVGSTHGQSPGMNGDAVASKYDHHETVKQFFKSHLDATPKEESKMFLTFIIPHEKEGLLTDFFSELQERVEEFGMADIQLGLTTLEEVFLNIAENAELENAVAEGAMVTLTLSTGAELIIRKGARFIGIPGTESADSPRGLMVEVNWEQDESGSLCISGHSPETPIPLGGISSARMHQFMAL